jgi:deoxyhypusine synthase
MPYTSVGKCVYKKNKSGERGAKVGCTRGDVRQYLRALYASDPKAAKNEISEIRSSLIESEKFAKIEADYEAIINDIKTHYDEMANLSHRDFIRKLKEVIKLNKNLQKLHKEYSKDKK